MSEKGWESEVIRFSRKSYLGWASLFLSEWQGVASPPSECPNVKALGQQEQKYFIEVSLTDFWVRICYR